MGTKTETTMQPTFTLIFPPVVRFERYAGEKRWGILDCQPLAVPWTPVGSWSRWNDMPPLGPGGVNAPYHWECEVIL